MNQTGAAQLGIGNAIIPSGSVSSSARPVIYHSVSNFALRGDATCFGFRLTYGQAPRRSWRFLSTLSRQPVATASSRRQMLRRDAGLLLQTEQSNSGVRTHQL